LTQFLESYLVPNGALYSANNNFSPYKPGQKLSYSNIGAALTGLSIQYATERPFDSYCEDTIFSPLQMNNTHWHRSQFPDPSIIATQYSIISGERIELPPYSLATWPDGGLRSSVHDVANYLGAIMNDGTWQGTRILDAASIKEMGRKQTPLNDGDPSEEQGLFWVRYEGALTHAGADPGASTLVWIEPQNQFGVVLLMNLDVDHELPLQTLTEALTTFGKTFIE
jgi:CubicO group peptidase (beta-lactamase class C family)